jgi:hypothetical protein
MGRFDKKVTCELKEQEFIKDNMSTKAGDVCLKMKDGMTTHPWQL